MKKRFGIKMAAIALAAATVVPLAAGCGAGGGDNGGSTAALPDISTLNADVIMQDVQTTMANVQAMSMSMDMTMDMSSTMMGTEETMKMDMDLNMVYKQDPMQIALTTYADSMGVTAEAAAYVVPDGDGYTCYLGEPDSTGTLNWTKNTVTGEDAAELENEFKAQLSQSAGTQQVTGLMDGVMTLEITGREQLNGETVLVMSGELDMESAMNAMSAAGSDSDIVDLEGMETMFEGVTVPVTYYIDETDKTLVKCDIDMKEMLDQIFSAVLSAYAGSEGTEGIDLSSLIQINEAALSVTIDGINGEVADVVVPADVIAAAEEDLSIETSDLPLFNGTVGV